MDLLRSSTDYASARRTVLDRGYRLGDHKAIKLRHLMDPACRNVRVAVASAHLSASDLRDTGIERFSQVEPAVRWLSSLTGARPKRHPKPLVETPFSSSLAKGGKKGIGSGGRRESAAACGLIIEDAGMVTVMPGSV